MVDACATGWSLAAGGVAGADAADAADVADAAGAVGEAAATAEGESAQWEWGCLQTSGPGEKDGFVAAGRADVTGHWLRPRF